MSDRLRWGRGEPPEWTKLPSEEMEARRLGDRGFAMMVQQLRRDASMTVASFVDSMKTSGATVEQARAIESGKVRATIDWVRIYADGLGISFALLFDVWDREGPSAEERLTVAEAKEMIARLLKAGVECPCCGRACKERRQSLTPNMVRFVCWLVRVYRGEPVEIRKWQREHAEYGGDYAKAQHWGLTKRAPGKAPRWSPTFKGVKFSRGQVKVHKFAVLWRNEVIRWEGDLLDVSELLGEVPVHDERQQEAHPTLPGIGRA